MGELRALVATEMNFWGNLLTIRYSECLWTDYEQTVSNSVFGYYLLTGRGSPLRTVHTMTLLTGTVAR
jgi:hypothetical protein